MSAEYLLFDESDILEVLDEYSLYCHYLEFIPEINGKAYKSPVRGNSVAGLDDTPSFGIFEAKKGYGAHEYLWKDYTTGISGNIFYLVMLMFGLDNRNEARRKVMSDFGMGESRTPKQRLIPVDKVYAEPVDIQVKSKLFTTRDLAYWDVINVNENVLGHFNTTSIGAYWTSPTQRFPQYPKGLGFAYRIWDKYQLYFPYAAEKKDKFRNNYTEACIFGHHQLRYENDTLIITKSAKDVMCLYSFGFEAVTPRSESVLVPEEFLRYYETKYKRILVLFDNDGKHRGADYPYKGIFVPKLVERDKDTTDFCTNHGKKETYTMLQQITA